MAQEREHATEFLKSLPVFAEIDDEELMKTVAKHFKRSKHAKGDVLAKEGEPQPGTRPHSSCQASICTQSTPHQRSRPNSFFLLSDD